MTLTDYEVAVIAGLLAVVGAMTVSLIRQGMTIRRLQRQGRPPSALDERAR